MTTNAIQTKTSQRKNSDLRLMATTFVLKDHNHCRQKKQPFFFPITEGNKIQTQLSVTRK